MNWRESDIDPQVYARTRTYDEFNKRIKNKLKEKHISTPKQYKLWSNFHKKFSRS